MSLLSAFVPRPLEARDVPAVLAIQEASAEAAQWRTADYTRIDQSETAAWVLEHPERLGEVIGFVVSRRAADEIEILNLAVHPEYRRRGAGSHLLAAVVGLGSGAGAKKVFLEVRASNAAAISLYKRFKFIEAGQRQGYYSAPNEDALILALDLHEEKSEGL